MLLALAYPLLEEVLSERDEEELTVHLPEFTSQDIRNRISGIFGGGLLKILRKEDNTNNETQQKDIMKICCSLCNIIFSQRPKFEEHTKRNHPLCSRCGQTFYNNEDFNNHTNKCDDTSKNIQNERDIVCSLCNLSYSEQKNFNKHVKLEHSIISKYKKQYNQIQTYRSNINVQIFKEIEETKIQEDIENIVNMNETETKIAFCNIPIQVIEKEKKTVTMDENTIVEVKQDEHNSLYTKHTTLLKNLTHKMGQRNRFGYYTCNECKHMGSDWEHFKDHLINDHDTFNRQNIVTTQIAKLLKEMEKLCLVPNALGPDLKWGNDFTVADAIARIMAESTLKMCHICAFSHNTSKGLQDHLFSDHQIKPFQCEKCGDEFDKLTQLKYHQTRKHNMWGGLVQCSHCENKYSITMLTRHMKHVNGETKEQCPECKNYYSGLNDHIRRYHRRHTKIKRPNPSKSQCKACAKLYNKGEQAKHQQLCKPIHRPVKCRLCQTTLNNIEFNKHFQTAHMENIFVDLHISGNFNSKNPAVWEATGLLLFQKLTEKKGTFCSICGEDRNTQNLMILHMKQHCGFTMKSLKGNLSKLCPTSGKTIMNQKPLILSKSQQKTEKRQPKTKERDQINTIMRRIRARQLVNYQEPTKPYGQGTI